ncbi:hypothetical protein FRC18_010866 [Serendipita sp. 400]|nr:hypothetical protein FRC18_010866 [Serendipita sp. 400]
MVLTLSRDDTCEDMKFDVYWHEGHGLPVLDTLDRFLPSCLNRMPSLDSMAYFGPAIRGPLHQAILSHKTLRCLRIGARTHCSVPCKDTLQKRSGNTAIYELEIVECGNEMDSFGFLGMNASLIGPRRCAFLSQIVWTHSASLRNLMVPIYALYDALRISSNFPVFPHLSLLSIEDPIEPLDNPGPYREMSAVVISFLLHVHATLVTLHWGNSVLEEMTKQITESHLPNLENLSGYKIRGVVQTRLLKRLGIISLSISDYDSETGWSLLREVSSQLPNLPVFALSTIVRLVSIPYDLCTFSNVVELWYEEQPGSALLDEESGNEGKYLFDFFRIIVPALPKLRDLCITVEGDSKKANNPEEIKDTLSLSSKSLRQVTFQWVTYPVSCFRLDAERENVESKWMFKGVRGFQWMRSFRL